LESWLFGLPLKSFGFFFVVSLYRGGAFIHNRHNARQVNKPYGFVRMKN
jgi:hypothetical protein